MNPQQGYEKEHKKIPTANSHGPGDNQNRFSSSVKNSLQSCMGFVDGLCCASLNQVSPEDREERSRGHLRDFMTSYDLSYLNSNIGDTHSTNSSDNFFSSSSAEKQDSMNSPGSEPKEFPSVEKDTTHHQMSISSPSMMHTVLPNSMLPRDYGSSHGHSGSSSSSPSTVVDTSIRYEQQLNGSDACCHSFVQFRGFGDDCHGSQYAQPHTLPSADTYTTVSMSQSYSAMMWDDDSDEEEEELSSDYVMSPVGSVFRKDENSTEEAAMMERDGPPSCSPSSTTTPFPTMPSSSIATKTHEAYQYLLRMKPQNYLHNGGSSDASDMEGGELCHSNNIVGGEVNQCGPLFLQ